jgi:1-pyrroline-5-carboxylate dehydrogenase
MTIPTLPSVRNEPVLTYAKGSPERLEVQRQLETMSSAAIEIPSVIGGQRIDTAETAPAVMPHNFRHILGTVHQCNAQHVSAAVEAALKAAADWSRWSAADRAAVFLKAAGLLSGPWRARLNAATMLGQSKTVHQAEIDAATELCDFLRFNAAFMRRIYEEQPLSPECTWNRVDYRPLEGFVYAITPFHFTAIAGNLPAAPALMGNVVIWKPAATATYAAHFVMRLLEEAGLPPGVINMVNGPGPEISEAVLANRHLAGVHFTGSTQVFNQIWARIGARISEYRTYPRIVGETGGKNFILAHASADLEALACAIIRGAFEYQGQKCSAASRIFVPRSLCPKLRERLLDEIAAISVGDVSDFSNFMGAVIDQKAHRKFQSVMEAARADPHCTVEAGGTVIGDMGYFAAPTLLTTTDAASRLLKEEFFLPITTCFVYGDDAYPEILTFIDQSAAYGLTGAVFSQDRPAIRLAETALRNAAGNFYINDKPTGAVVGQQPFGGARASGTNDKAGSLWNLIRWASPRTIKENFVPPKNWRYPFMDA